MDSRFNREKQKDLNEQHTKLLKSLMARPENKKCADCRRKDPRWASWNLGVFVCIQCSGIHRSIGTHVSKVKSADLDTWTPEQIENMVRWGNEKANLYWEHSWPKDSTPSEKSMDNFIRAKYERKQYVRSMDVPDPSTLGSASASDAIVVESKPSSISAVKMANTTQSTFNAFGQAPDPNDVPPLTIASSASASQQLFDAFSAPAPSSAQAQKAFKDSIMSMYATPSSSTKSAVPSPHQSTFGDFNAPPVTSTFVFESAALGPITAPQLKTNTFDPFNNLVETKPLTTSNQTFDAFASLDISSSSFAKASTNTNPAKPVADNLLGDFEEPPSYKKEVDSFGDFTGKSSDPVVTDSAKQPAFGDFASVTSSSTNAPAFTSTSVTLPEHSRASTGFGDVQSPSRGTPVNFANLPPIEDGWSSFQ